VTAQTPASPPADLVEVGRVTDAWGVKGWLRVDPFNSPHQSVLLKIRDWWLRTPPDETPACLRVTRCRVHGGALVVKPGDCEDRDQALRLKSASIFVSRAQFPAAAPGEWYWVDLVGCSVMSLAGEPLGVVESVEDHGAHPILVVRSGERQLLIPFVEQIVSQVDTAARTISADWGADY
jgi:16S rRNA processing protein RimM